jgi:hypothetical protein
MNISRKKAAMGLSIGVVALGSGGAAIAATAHTSKAAITHAKATLAPHGPGMGGGPPGGGPGADLDAAAAYLGVTSAVLQSDLQSGQTLADVASATSGKTTDGLVAALVTARTADWDAQVTAGTLTQAQETSMLSSLTQRVTDLVNGKGGPGGGPGPGHGPGGPGGPGGGPGPDFAAAASYLGVTTATLQSDLQSGKTLADVASATSGKTTAGLISALVTSATSDLDAKVTAGTFTQAQETAILVGLTQHVTDFVNGTGGPGPHGH